jgi:hypothetical protein
MENTIEVSISLGSFSGKTFFSPLRADYGNLLNQINQMPKKNS